jgi:hypothetical protein
MYNGKAIIGKSNDSQGEDYFYFDGQDINIKTFGDTVQEALQNARTHFDYLIEDTVAKYNNDKSRKVKVG